MRRGSRITSFLSAGFVLLPAMVLAQDCQKCGELVGAIRGLRETQESLVVMKNMNEATLEKLTDDDRSRKIKLRSNLMIIGVKLETLENQLKSKGELKDTHCRGCSVQQAGG